MIFMQPLSRNLNAFAAIMLPFSSNGGNPAFLGWYRSSWPVLVRPTLLFLKRRDSAFWFRVRPRQSQGRTKTHFEALAFESSTSPPYPSFWDLCRAHCSSIRCWRSLYKNTSLITMLRWRQLIFSQVSFHLFVHADTTRRLYKITVRQS